MGFSTLSLQKELKSERIETEWESILAGWNHAMRHEIAGAREWIRHLRNQCVNILNEADDPQKAFISAASKHIELKFMRQGLVAQKQYQIIKRGIGSPELTHRAELLQTLISILDRHTADADLASVEADQPGWFKSAA